MKYEKSIVILIVLFFFVIISRLFYICIIEHDYYLYKYNNLNEQVFYLGNPVRGRILDCNGKIIVGNKGVKSLYALSNNVDVNKISESLNMEISLVYEKLNNGYYYEPKLIKSDLSDNEIIDISYLNDDNLIIVNDYKRVFNYDTSFNQLIGNIGYIPKEEVRDYLNKGYSLNDLVGVSFLEKYYESTLKGTKSKYLFKDNKITLLEEGKRGSDLVLSIDIDLQIKVDSLLKSEMSKAKLILSSKYYNGSYVIINDINNFGIKVISAYSFKDDEFIYNTVGAIRNSYAVGSVVKGASQSVAYINGVIDLNSKINDSCVKLFGMPKKCSWKRLGYLSDIDALTYSSNYYQFINVIKVCGSNYTYNMKFNPGIDGFNKYRNVFNSYGLGSKSGIDLYEEKEGITGKKYNGDLLLNLSIGQYDTYTPVMVSSYVSTIANNGIRKKLRIVDYAIDNNGNKIHVNDENIISNVNIDLTYLKRIQVGMKNVMIKGTGVSYNKSNVSSAGKTGTSETFYNGENTTTKSFILYAPFEEPVYSITIISPNIATKGYKYPINSNLSSQIMNILFEK